MNMHKQIEQEWIKYWPIFFDNNPDLVKKWFPSLYISDDYDNDYFRNLPDLIKDWNYFGEYMYAILYFNSEKFQETEKQILEIRDNFIRQRLREEFMKVEGIGWEIIASIWHPKNMHKFKYLDDIFCED